MCTLRLCWIIHPNTVRASVVLHERLHYARFRSIFKYFTKQLMFHSKVLHGNQDNYQWVTDTFNINVLYVVNNMSNTCCMKQELICHLCHID